MAQAGDELIAAADEPPAVGILRPGGRLPPGGRLFGGPVPGRGLSSGRLSGGRLGPAARIGELRRLVRAPRRPAASAARPGGRDP
ncbi:hypothetical protein ACFQ2Y_22260 [Streptomyces malaysiensis subsp. malaysiensis]